MNLYHQLIENPLFFKWIYHPSPEINTYWEYYLEEHPDEAHIIREFKAGFEKYFRYKEHSLTNEEREDLVLQILKNMELHDKKSKKRRLLRLTLRYAAVGLLFLILGSGVTYLVLEKNDNNLAQIPLAPDSNIQQPTLILENNQEIALNQGESNLEYSDQGEVIVDHKKVEKVSNYQEVSMNTLVIPYGNRSTIMLADGSKVWLNAGSRLIYPSRFVDRNREVFLVGEAFFEVAKNEEQPFIVNTPDIQIKVLGTQFNLSAYPEENIVQTVLTEGSVELEWLNGGIFDRSTQITPDQMIVANKKEKNTAVYNVDTDYYTSWKEGYLTFNNSDLSRVVKKLERYYNLHFHYDDPMDGMMKISGKLDVTNEKEIVFKYMNSLTGLTFTKYNATTYMIK